MFYIYTHKSFTLHNNYKKVINKFNIITSNNSICNNFEIPVFNDNTDMSVLQHALCESHGQYYIYKNIENFNDNIIGFLTYRRLMSPVIYEMAEEILNKYDFICVDNNIYENIEKMKVKDDFTKFHNINDLIQCCYIAQSLYNIKTNIINIFLNTPVNYHFNIYITKRELFIKYSEFIFNIIKEFCKRNSIYDMDNVKQHIEKNKHFYKNNGYYDFNAQLRLLGFFHEFLLQLFIFNYKYTVYGTYYIMT